MKTQLFRFTLYAIIVYLTGGALNFAVAAPQPSAENGTFHCGVIDGQPRFNQDSKRYSDQFPNRRYARTFAANLNVGEPHTVRLIYFLPDDSQPPPDIDTRMDVLIKAVHQFFADEMERHGFGRKTFTFEADATGKTVVHHVKGKFTASHYDGERPTKIRTEIHEQVDTSKYSYLVVVHHSISLTLGTGGGGIAIIGSRRNWNSDVMFASHELGHVWGLSHDFRSSSYLMSYGRGPIRKLSQCAAGWLSASPFFNTNQNRTSFNKPAVIEMLPPSFAFPPYAIRLRFKVDDLNGLHQAQLITYEMAYSSENLTACKQLEGTSSTVEFVTTALTLRSNSVTLLVIDVHGNLKSGHYPIDLASLLPPPKVVSIPDANLTAIVRRTLGERITSYTMLDLWRFDASNSQVTDLTGLEHATNLKVLTLSDNSISDISSVAGLTNLEWLWLDNTSIVDISPVAGLTNLVSLRLNNTSIVDISPVAGLTNLVSLRLNNTSIVDISPVAGLTNLTYLTLSNTSISDVSALAGLTQLTGLNLNNTSISDVSALAGLTQLTSLGLSNNAISGVSALAGLTQLTSLGLSNNAISGVSALAGLTQLTSLGLSNNAISGVSALAGLTQLTWLNLSNNAISDVSALAGLTQLTWLNLYNNAISDVSALAGLTQLTVLRLSYNDISDVSPLLGLNLTGTQWNSTGLYLYGNPLSYASINTYIPAIQAKGVEVKFDNRTPTTLVKISEAEQQATVNAALAHPFVVEVRDEQNRAFSGVPVTFAVTAGGGTLSVTNTTTDENGRAESTLTLGPNPGTNTISVSAAGIEPPVTFNAAPAAYLLSVPAGISLIHVPLKVIAVDGVAKPIESISDLYDALGGADTVNFLITYDSKTQQWFGFFGPSDTGTPDDQGVTDDTGVIAGMITPVAIRLIGNPLGTNGSSTITLNPGFNLVGLPLKDPRITRVSDLFALEGIGGNVHRITLADSGKLKLVERAGDPSDIPIIGGQSFFLRALRKAIVVISGDGWYNASGIAASPPIALKGIQVDDVTPVLGVRGSIIEIDEEMGSNKAGFRVIVKNLSTGRAVAAVTKDESLSRTDRGESMGGGYQVTIVDVETGRAAQIGDRLEISVRSPDPLIGVQPLQYTVTAEDVKRSRVELADLVAYEIPTETELLRNYPNPFNPETWIPYRLTEDAFVTLTIYDLSGQVVRTLDVGHRIAAVYESQSKAIYWDGRNGLGEQVASGVYFYHLTAGDYSATRKMVILK